MAESLFSAEFRGMMKDMLKEQVASQVLLAATDIRVKQLEEHQIKIRQRLWEGDGDTVEKRLALMNAEFATYRQLLSSIRRLVWTLIAAIIIGAGTAVFNMERRLGSMEQRISQPLIVAPHTEIPPSLDPEPSAIPP